jgi:DNA-binding transcriptional MerR regulator
MLPERDNQIRILFDSVTLSGYNTVMKEVDEVRWTIEQLRDAVSAALGDGYDGPPNGRVRDVPDERTIRYYTTLGLIDRALEMRGRTALYGQRHLLQLVAIKKLQAKGQALALVQRTLAGQTDAALERLAGLGSGPAMTSARAIRHSRREFWKEMPPPSSAPASDETESVAEEAIESAPPAEERPQSLQGVTLAENVTLLLAASRPLKSEDLEALRSVSRPLIDLLVKLEITPPREERGFR